MQPGPIPVGVPLLHPAAPHQQSVPVSESPAPGRWPFLLRCASGLLASARALLVLHWFSAALCLSVSCVVGVRVRWTEDY